MANRAISSLDISSMQVGDLKLADIVVNSVAEQHLVDSITNYLNGDADSISVLSTTTTTICSQISGLTSQISNLNSLLTSLSTLVNDLSAKAVTYMLNSVSLTKPESDTPICLCAWFYDDPRMETPLTANYGIEAKDITFDSMDSSCSAYIEAFLANNAKNIDAESNEKKNSVVLQDQGTQWMKPIGGAFGEEYNDQPVVLRLVDWAVSSHSLSTWASSFSKSTKLYMKYTWYYKENGVVHASDIQSMALPSQTENAHLEQKQQDSSTFQVIEVLYTDSNDANFSRDAYSLYPRQISMLKEGIDATHNTLNLAGYSTGVEYKMKFKAKATMLFGGNKSNSMQVYGDGALIDELNGSTIHATCQAGKTYLMSILAGMVSILASE